jgi:DoxX-like protein
MKTGTMKILAAGTGTAKAGAIAGERPTNGVQMSGAVLDLAARRQVVVSDRLIRLAIAMVWLYQGLWCKVLGGAPRHEAVIAAAPFIGPAAARGAMVAIGLVECGLAVWVLSGWRMRWAALAQTAQLVGMNAAGLLWARSLLADPVGMILQNFAFVLLIWIAAEDRRLNRGKDGSHVDHA